MSQAQKWKSVCPKLRRVQEVAQAKPKEKFTSLAHHLTLEALRRSYQSLDGKAVPALRISDSGLWVGSSRLVRVNAKHTWSAFRSSSNFCAHVVPGSQFTIQ